MTDLITEAREQYEQAKDVCETVDMRAQMQMFGISHDEYLELSLLVEQFPELCDALEKAQEQNKQLLHEVCKLACESVEREKTLARLEAEVGVALGKGCDCCGLIYAIHAESYGIEDLDCANEPIDNKFCPMCGKKLPVYAGTIGGEIVQHALKELGRRKVQSMNEIERLKSIDVNGSIAQAIREKQERESGCEWCKTPSHNPDIGGCTLVFYRSKAHPIGAYAISVSVFDEYGEEQEPVLVRIDNCIHCGKRLEVKHDGT